MVDTEQGSDQRRPPFPALDVEPARRRRLQLRPIATLASMVRALATRIGATAMIFVVALVAVAAATAGPTYYAAAQTSILQDGVRPAAPLGRGFDITQTGSVDMGFGPLEGDVIADLGRSITLFDTPVEALSGTAFDAAHSQTLSLVWRSGLCGQLAIVGSCPTARNQVVVSRLLATNSDWHVGQVLTFPTWGALKIVGIYTPPSVITDYFFDDATSYFPVEYPPSGSAHAANSSAVDALFTAQATLSDAPDSAQGTVELDAVLNPRALTEADVEPLLRAVNNLSNDDTLNEMQAIVTSDIPATLATVKSGWSSLAIPVLLITLQLLGLAWLLLFLLLTDAVTARAAEVALARLRGYGRWRTIVFALSEPVALLVMALPVGVLVGWAASVALGHTLLLPGIGVGLPALGWGAAVAATVGGLAAVIGVSQRILRRPVVEQWSGSSARRADRTWVVDGVLLTGAAAGLLELVASGSVTSAHRDALSLLVPGLLGVAVAVIASRLLPVACTIAIGRARRGGLAMFLALRHVSRRPGGSRITIMLATAFSLATFALSAWAVGVANYRTVADVDVGAPTVVTVNPPNNSNFAALVSKADPTGRHATPVEEYSANNLTTIAVDPANWDRIASWSGAPLSSSLISALAPSTPPPLELNGDQVRLHLSVRSLAPPASGLTMDVLVPSATATTPIAFAPLSGPGTFTETAALPGCPCSVQDITVEENPSLEGQEMLAGAMTITGIDVHGPNGWQPVDTHFSDGTRWTSGGDNGGQDNVTAGTAGLSWTFNLDGANAASIIYHDRPVPLPAVVTTSVTNGATGAYTATGLDGGALPVNVVATVGVVPGTPAGGVLVDRQFAEIAAANNISLVTQQVWITHGSAGQVIAALKAEGVTIVSSQTAAGAAAAFGRQGPGLAQVLFLAEAGTAAILAAAGAVLGLYLFARRRRYELAALAATGVRRRTLLGAVLVEQLIVVAFGVTVGIGSGLVAAALVLRDVPEFLSPPQGPPLSTFPSVPLLVTVLAIGVLLAFGAATTASISLVRGMRLEQLREAVA